MRAGQAGDIRYLQDEDGRKKRRGAGEAEEGEPEGQEGEEGVEAGSERVGSRTRSPSESPFPSMGAAGSMHLFVSQRQNAFASRRLNAAAIDEVYTYRRDSSSTPSQSKSPNQARGSGSADHSQVIFGAIGSKESGLMRSKSSLAAERRERNKKELNSRENSTAGPSVRAGSGESVSTSPESERERSGSAIGEDVSPIPQPGSKPASQQDTPTSALVDDGSVEEVVGSNPVSRSQSDTPGPGDGLISVREDVDIDDDEDEDENEDEEDEDEDEEEEEPEPDLDDVFAGRAGSVRR